MTCFIMSETPAPCQFRCEYCYVPHSKASRDTTKKITAEDYLRLGDKMGDGPHMYWMCASGETFMQDHMIECYHKLSVNNKIIAVSNLSYDGNDARQILDGGNIKNMGVYWSLHLAEMAKHSCVYSTAKRATELTTAGVRIWPTLVYHPAYFGLVNLAMDLAGCIGAKLIITRYREGIGDLAQMRESDDLRARLDGDDRIDWRLWDLTPCTWDMSGGNCNAGVGQIIIDASWRLGTCYGSGNKLFYGQFPEDIDKIPLQKTGICKSKNCPCKHSIMWGVNDKFNLTFNDILNGFDDFWEGAK